MIALTGESEAPASPVRAWAEEELHALTERGLRRHLEPLQSPQGAEVVIAGVRLVNFSSNDYLGLARDAEVARALSASLPRHGVGTGASRLIVGDTDSHRALEGRLARFMGAEAALLFNSGYAANLGILSSLVGEGDVIFSDALNHASMIDGCRLSRARTVIYPHVDLHALERLLRTTPGRRRLVCTDSVFSMDGDRAPLRELAALCRHHGAALMVDEAHAIGVLGGRGAGLAEALGLEDAIDLRVGTLGKALGTFGAFVACSRPVRELLFNRARSLVFSTALPASLCAATIEALDVLERTPLLRDRLRYNMRRFADGLCALGWEVAPESAIFPVVLGAPSSALEASCFLRQRGLLVKAIRPPTVPAGTSRLRFALSAAHRDEHLDLALEALAALRETL